MVPLSTDWRCCTGRVSTQLAPVLGLSGFDSGFKPQETKESSRLFSLLLVAQVDTASSRHASEMSILPSLLPSFHARHTRVNVRVCVPAEARAGLQAPSVGLCLFALRQGLPLTRSSPFWLSCLVSELSGSAFLYPLRLQAHASTSICLLGIPAHILLLTEHALFPTKASPQPLRRFSSGVLLAVFTILGKIIFSEKATGVSFFQKQEYSFPVVWQFILGRGYPFRNQTGNPGSANLT